MHIYLEASLTNVIGNGLKICSTWLNFANFSWGKADSNSCDSRKSHFVHPLGKTIVKKNKQVQWNLKKCSHFFATQSQTHIHLWGEPQSYLIKREIEHHPLKRSKPHFLIFTSSWLSSPQKSHYNIVSTQEELLCPCYNQLRTAIIKCKKKCL